MRMGDYMNGAQPQVQQQQQPPAVLTPDTPLAYYTPIAITPGTIKWFMGAIVGVIGFLATAPVAERYLNPAKQSDLETLTKVVQVIQTGQAESRAALERLTLAVDNLAGIVTEIKQAKNAAPKLKIR
jgi:hypothetical protein